MERKRSAPATCPHTECGIEKEEVRATSTESHFLGGKTECDVYSHGVCVLIYLCMHVRYIAVHIYMCWSEVNIKCLF